MFRIDSEHVVDATRTGGLARYEDPIGYLSCGEHRNDNHVLYFSYCS